LADRIIAVSELTKRTIHREYAIPLDKIDVVHNNFDQELMIPEQGPNAYTYLTQLKRKGYRVVSNVGRITIQKGLPNLLQAFRIVMEYAPKTMLLIAGAGEQYYELITLAAELGIARNVVFADFQRGKGYRDTFTIADLFVVPSISEPFAITALEAVVYNVPVLVSKQTGVSEVIRNFLKVDFWDIHEMANQITGVMQNEVLGAELERNAHREYECLSWDHAADKVQALYGRHAETVRL